MRSVNDDISKERISHILNSKYKTHANTNTNTNIHDRSVRRSVDRYFLTWVIVLATGRAFNYSDIVTHLVKPSIDR